MAKKGIHADVDRAMRILDATPDSPADIAANLLNQARISGDGPLRRKYLSKAQEAITEIDPHDDSETLQNLQAQVLALQGRGGDTQIAHVTPGEIVVPRRMRTPELMATLARAARQAGIDPARLVVGGRHNAVNPHTGQAEFCDVVGTGQFDSSEDLGNSNAPETAAWQRPPLNEVPYREPCSQSALTELFSAQATG